MNSLRHLDDQILTDINGSARHTGWLHGVFLGYANYGVVLVAVLLLGGLWLRRAGSDRRLAAARWACLATVIAVRLNQTASARVRRGPTLPGASAA